MWYVPVYGQKILFIKKYLNAYMLILQEFAAGEYLKFWCGEFWEQAEKEAVNGEGCAWHQTHPAG